MSALREALAGMLRIVPHAAAADKAYMHAVAGEWIDTRKETCPACVARDALAALPPEHTEWWPLDPLVKRWRVSTCRLSFDGAWWELEWRRIYEDGVRSDKRSVEDRTLSGCVEWAVKMEAENDATEGKP